MNALKYHLKNEWSIFVSKVGQKLNTLDPSKYFITQFKNKDYSSKEDYKCWKLFQVMSKTTDWHKKWISDMSLYLENLDYPLKYEIITNTGTIKTTHQKTFKKTFQDLSFAYLLNQVPKIRKKLNLESFPKSKKANFLSEELVFTNLNIEKDLDPDFGIQGTFFLDKTTCLITQSTALFLANQIENCLDYFKVFRRETSDKSHLCEFFQLEYVKKYTGLDPVNKLISDFILIFRSLGLKAPIHIRPTRNNYTYPSFEYFTEDPFSKELIEIGNSGIMDPQTLTKVSKKYDPKAYYLAGALGLERLFMVIKKIKHISEVKNNYYF